MIAMVPPRKPHNPFWPSADDYDTSSAGSHELIAYDDYEDGVPSDATGTTQSFQRKSNIILRNHSIPDPNAYFGQEYSKFYEAFGLGKMQEPRVIENVVPAKRPAETTTKPSKRSRPNTSAPLTQVVERQSPSRTKKPSIGEKVQPKLPRGTGIYKTGTWEYVTDDKQEEEKIQEHLKEISAITQASTEKPAKITRGSYREMKSRLEGGSPAVTPRPPTKGPALSRITQSSEASRTPPVELSSAVSHQSGEADPVPDSSASPTLTKNQETPSIRDSPASYGSALSYGSTPAPDQPTRSTSASTLPQQDPEAEQLTRPNLSWNAIVYGVLAHSQKPTLTLPEIIEGVKERHPFFRSKQQAETVKSSTRNPLYCRHPAFYKETRPDESVAWGLKPGQFLDKKTKRILTPGPPTISVTSSAESKRHSEEKDAHEDVTSKPAVSSPDPGDHEEPNEAINHVPDSDHGFKQPATIEPSPKTSTEELPESVADGMAQPGLSSDHVQEKSRTSSLATEVTQPRARSPASTISVLQSREQRRLEGIVHKDLVEAFTTDDMEGFLRDTKLSYFKNMDLRPDDVSRILAAIFLSGSKSSDSDVEECARDLCKDYEHRVWASDWFLEFVKDEVTKFDTNMGGVIKYTERPRPVRLDFWLNPSMWNRNTLTRLLAPLNDAVDTNKVWCTKHWHDYVRKIYATVCDATWEHRLQSGVPIETDRIFESIRTVIADRYPDRSSAKIWDVPRIQATPVKPIARKESISGSIPTSPAAFGNPFVNANKTEDTAHISRTSSTTEEQRRIIAANDALIASRMST